MGVGFFLVSVGSTEREPTFCFGLEKGEEGFQFSSICATRGPLCVLLGIHLFVHFIS